MATEMITQGTARPAVEDRSDCDVVLTREGGAIRRYLEQHSRHHLSVLLTNPGAELFTFGNMGGIGFVRHKRCVVVLGGVMGNAMHRLTVLNRFMHWCADENRHPLFLHFPPEDIPLLNDAGCSVNQVGACYGIQLERYSMAGKRFQQLRYKINKAAKRGIVVREVTSTKEFAAVKPQLEIINDSWLAGKKAKPIRILVADFDRVTLSAERARLLVATHNGELIAYILYLRTWGADAGWFHSLSRHRMGSVDGSMQLINKTFLDSLPSDERYLHFGFTPLVEMGQDRGQGSRVFSRLAAFLAQRGGVVYPARSQRQYKCSWRPTHVQPEYFAYRSGALPALVRLLVVTNSI